MSERQGFGLNEESALARIQRPAVGFSHPSDVAKDPHLSTDEKRLVLSSWASDACAIEGRPGWRQALGSDFVAPLTEILAALRRLDEPPASPDLTGSGGVTPVHGGFDVRRS